MSGVGRVYLRNRIWWIAYYVNGNEVRCSAHTESKQQAHRYLAKKIRAQFTESKATFGTLTKLVEQDYVVRKLKTLRDLKNKISHLKPYFADLRASDVTTSRIRRYIAERLKHPAAHATVNRELGVLKRAFHLGIQDGLVPAIPFVPMLPEMNVREGFVSHDQFEKIKAQLPSDTLRDVADFIYLTGWRVTEALTLEWRDIDLDHGTIRLRAERSKNAKPRLVRMGDRLSAVLKRRLRARRLDCRLVFHRGRKLMLRESVSRAWRRAAKRAKCDGIILHDLRRTTARNLVRAGVPERVVMSLLGHRTRSMLDRYNIVSDDDLAEAQDRLGAYLDSAIVRSLSANRSETTA